MLFTPSPFITLTTLLLLSPFLLVRRAGTKYLKVTRNLFASPFLSISPPLLSNIQSRQNDGTNIPFEIYPKGCFHFCKITKVIKCRKWPLYCSTRDYNLIKSKPKICIVEVYLLKCYFESHIIYKWCYYRQIIFNELNIMVSYVDIMVYAIGSQFYDKYMWCGLNFIWGGCTSISSACLLRDLVKA